MDGRITLIQRWALHARNAHRPQISGKEQNKTERDIQNTYIESAKKTFKDSIENFQTEQNKYSSKLVVNVEDLTGYTHNLSSALRSTSGSGQWGEMQLERVVELAGMVEYCDFETQKRMKKDDGTTDIPDLIVFLPSIGKTVTGRMAVDLSLIHI